MGLEPSDGGFREKLWGRRSKIGPSPHPWREVWGFTHAKVAKPRPGRGADAEREGGKGGKRGFRIRNCEMSWAKLLI